MKPESKARIIDIALQAGVSTATVDRVLNKRSGVRQITIDRVIETVKWLEKGPKRPTIIPTITSDLTLDVIIAGGAGFSNDVRSNGRLKSAASRFDWRYRNAWTRRRSPAH